MIGIIATIIAARKRHFTFAWVIGLWTAFAIVMALNGSAGGLGTPGWLFLVIAICMKKLPEESNGSTVAAASDSIKPPNVSTQTDSKTLIPAAPGNPAVNNNGRTAVDSPLRASTVIRFCRYCGKEYEAGSKFCRHCGARIE